MPRREPLLEHPMRALPVEGGSISPRAKVGDYLIQDRGFETPCWIWQRTTDERGYGKLSPTTRSVEQRAHREYYRLAYGEIPAGHDIHHRCEQTSCVNPAHLEPKTRVVHLQGHMQDESVLTWETVREIRARFARGGASVDALAEVFGIGKSQIHNILINHNWHDPGFVPGRHIDCDWCGESFVASRSHQRFCCKRHRKAYNRRKQLVPGGYVERRRAA